MPEEQREITLGLLNAVQENSNVTQRHIARELGVALGLVNAYLTRSVKKGYIKVRHAPANRYAYYLTPAGFAEKGRLTAKYLTQSFTFFRNARHQCSEILETCVTHSWPRIALAGASDLAEIMMLCAAEYDVELVGLVDITVEQNAFMGRPVVDRLKKLGPVDAVVVTDLTDPQSAYTALAEHFPAERILAPGILGIVRNAPKARKKEGA